MIREGNVLVVEDNAPCFILIREYLNMMNLNYTRAKSSVEVIEALKLKNFVFALVDLRLCCGDNGFNVIQTIKYSCPELPVIVQTANVTAESKERSFYCGADYFMPKPYTFDTLQKALQSIENKSFVRIAS